MKAKNHGFKFIVLSFLAASLIFSSGAAINALKIARADELLVETEIKEYYDVNDSFTVPDATIGGKTAESVIEFPDGKAVKSKEIELTLAGVYKITYSASGKKAVKTFTATNKKYYTSSGAAEPVLTDETYTYTDKSVSAGGISVTLSAGDVFYYDKIIDVSAATKNDRLIKFIVNANNPGKCDARLISVKFVDIENQDNYFEVQYWDPDYTDGRWIYLRTGANGSINTSNGVYQSDTQSYGTDSLGSMKSSNLNTATGETLVSRNDSGLCNEYQECSIDYATKIVYGANSPYGDEGAICDLDNSLYYSNPWEGFKSGKCRVEISASLFQSSTVNLLIMNVWDDDYDDFKNDRYIDNEKPVLNVDFGEYEEGTLPAAVCGNGYKLFACSAVDYLGDVKQITKKVYFNYGSASASEIPVVGGAFTPSNAGQHTLVYTAEDYFGNKTEKLISINCVSGSNFSIEVDADTNQYLTGETITVGDYVVKNASGNAEVSIYAKTPSGGKQEISLETPTFVPMESGKYEICYKAVDYVGRVAEASYDVQVGLNEYPAFLEKVTFPKYFIQGYENSVPSLSAYDFGAEKYVTAELYIKEGSETERKIDGFDFTPIISDDGDYELSVYYKATGQNGKQTTYPVYTAVCRNISKYTLLGKRDGTRIDKTKLFVTQAEGSYEKLGSSNYSSPIVHYSFDKEQSFTYVNPVNSRGFYTEFYVLNDGANALSSIDFIFTDYQDEQKQLKITLQLSENKVYASVNDGYTKYFVDGASFKKTLIDLVLNDSDGLISVGNAAFEYKITEFLNGEKFVPFTDGKAYLQIRAYGVSGTAKIAFKSVMGESFSGYSDIGAPVVSLLENESSVINYGESFVLSPARVIDAVLPSVRGTLTMIDPDGNYVVASDGTVLNGADMSRSYTITFAKYGEYVKTYLFGENSSSKRYVVRDKISPEINAFEGIKTKYSVNDTIKLSALVSDNYSSAENCKLYVSVYKPNGRIETLKINENYKFTEKGKYKLMYYAYDEGGNYTFTYKNITVG